ncbi:MAG: hypothetical protein IJU21_01970, partial [Bacteroidales bacterium]|nr:hypothetical protein [Bacteroidales bacterium]
SSTKTAQNVDGSPETAASSTKTAQNVDGSPETAASSTKTAQNVDGSPETAASSTKTAQNVDGAAAALSDKYLYEAGVFLTPGFIFGSNGANYLRISLCANVPTLEKALAKVASV